MTIILFIVAYLIGSFPTALIVGRLAFNIDIREHGSNNPGATNTLRVLGKKAAIIVLLIDVGKGALAANLPVLLGLEIDSLLIGLAAVFGHCFPIFAGFRGGKAIATTAGVLIAANIWMFFAAYLAFFLVIYISKYVYYGSISVGLALLIYSFFTPNREDELIFSIFLLFLIYLHRSNIHNHFHKREPKINDKSLKDDRIPPKNNAKRA
ncbi:glycerol-3-phosphate 1-O-acyltransferase PlsY [Bacillus sp. S/N-304-OC-R1]|uniref:glycerol-3-phosphate 1-O-acyltransferase PlsY n=1 Tax=Bacillus sp. S/N-304-OC-R1 TaxID=2758034 RepID=UPI001C8ED909|nr:glycerol-3-phosphate 1-O-acyltransferase PlsY [Bacillus sp. S/N-304-OC-R1]MBY0122207.1 glycerol-3-phosphate 1-O-acyltransferase PlsY [Bacillus sp. S/N-304-OC-R1]